jgi:hypothetical protein
VDGKPFLVLIHKTGVDLKFFSPEKKLILTGFSRFGKFAFKVLLHGRWLRQYQSHKVLITLILKRPTKYSTIRTITRKF